MANSIPSEQHHSAPMQEQPHSPIAAPYSPSGYSNANYAQSDVSGLEDAASSLASESSVSMWDEGRDASLLNRPRRNPPHHQQNDGTALSPVRESGVATQNHAAIDSGVDPWEEKQQPSLRQEFPPPPRRSVSSSESDSAASAQGPTPRHQHPHHRQPTHPLSSLAHDPAFVQCPHCHTQAVTRTEKRSSERSSGWPALLCPCFTSPSGSCDTYHHCGGCNAVLVIVSHDGQVTVVAVPGAAGGVNVVQLPPPVAVSPVSPCEKKKGGGGNAGRESREYRSELEGGGEERDQRGA